MTARPILFTGDMVRAILDGRKTQTRRPVKPQPDKTWEDGRPWWNIGGLGGTPSCPYGLPGDLLWVRETWAIPDSEPLRGRVLPREDVAYAASCPLVDIESPSIRWRPSIHMQRWACRLALEVVSVRVERVQEITEEGAKAEGCPPCIGISACGGGCDSCPSHNPRQWYASLWNSIYIAKGLGWDANPWVWVVEFKVAASTLSEAQATLEAA